MENLINYFNALLNSPFVYGLIVAFIIILIRILLHWKRSLKDNKKIKEYILNNPMAVIVYTKRSKSRDYIAIVSIDDKFPITFKKFFSKGFLMNHGEGRLVVNYKYVHESILHRFLPRYLGNIRFITIPTQIIDVKLNSSSEYSMKFNHQNNQFEFKEK